MYDFLTNSMNSSFNSNATQRSAVLFLFLLVLLNSLKLISLLVVTSKFLTIIIPWAIVQIDETVWKSNKLFVLIDLNLTNKTFSTINDLVSCILIKLFNKKDTLFFFFCFITTQTHITRNVRENLNHTRSTKTI